MNLKERKSSGYASTGAVDGEHDDGNVPPISQYRSSEVEQIFVVDHDLVFIRSDRVTPDWRDRLIAGNQLRNNRVIAVFLCRCLGISVENQGRKRNYRREYGGLR